MQKQPFSLKNMLRRLYELLSSMRFAVSLLILLSIASVAGTIIQQNMQAIEYTRRYGAFWVAFFEYIELHNIYSAKWFLCVLLFLVLSTSLCLVKNTPKMLREVRAYRENIQLKALASFPHFHQGTVASSMTLSQATEQAQGFLQQKGFRLRQKKQTEGILLAAKKGMWNRLGYIFAHAAIVFICLGGLLNGELMTGWQIWWHQKEGVTENMSIAAVPDSAKLPTNTPSFRANMRITEGSTRSEAVVVYNSEYYLQPLPFTIRLKDFIVEYYETGMPSNFVSHVEVYHPKTQQTTEHSIAVNHPLSIDGYTIYQSGLDDDSSSVQMKGYPLDGSVPFVVKPLFIGETTDISSNTTSATSRVELAISQFKVRNIENFNTPTIEDPAQTTTVLGVLGSNTIEKNLKDFGPSVEYSLRYPAGETVNYKTYMNPIEDEQTGMFHYIFGAQIPTDPDFKYLFIPADEKLSLARFFQMREDLIDEKKVLAAVERVMTRQYADISVAEKQAFAAIALQSTRYFAEQGIAGQMRLAYILAQQLSGETEVNDALTSSELMAALRKDLRAGRAQRLKSFYGLLTLTQNLTKAVVSELYLEQIHQQSPTAAQSPEDIVKQAKWVEGLVQALSDIHQYPAPFILTLEDYQHIESSIFQVSRSSGSFLLYAGCILLILGVFMMLYIPQRRLWIHLQQSEGAPIVWRMAMTSVRRGYQFDTEFENYQSTLKLMFLDPNGVQQ